jgi:hypothetical protein|tara:strand:+ start:57 stop:284 length:228 start_codon:yes stop_codon:yes gene_type:complete
MFSSQDLPTDSIPFLTHPMTFNDSIGNPMPIRSTYYETRNQPIANGIERTNLSGPRLKFVHDSANEYRVNLFYIN